MYEFFSEPSRSNIMRHDAWEVNQDMLARCRELNKRVGRSLVYCLTTALALMGRQAPQTCTVDANVLHIVFPEPKQVRNYAGAVSHSWKPLNNAGAIITIAGVQCTSPAATFTHIASCCSLEDGILLADSLMCRDQKLRRATPQDLDAFVASAKGASGVREAQWALKLACPNTDSPAEGRMRLKGRAYGLPECVANSAIDHDGPEACFIDMGWPEYRVGMEYQGMHHQYQYVQDTMRNNVMLAHDWKVFQAYAQTLDGAVAESRFFSQVSSALHRAGSDHVFTWDPVPLEKLAGPRPRSNRS